MGCAGGGGLGCGGVGEMLIGWFEWNLWWETKVVVLVLGRGCITETNSMEDSFGGLLAGFLPLSDYSIYPKCISSVILYEYCITETNSMEDSFGGFLAGFFPLSDYSIYPKCISSVIGLEYGIKLMPVTITDLTTDQAAHSRDAAMSFL